MDCLWLTLADPDPAINGQLIYSRGLIESVHRAGANLCIIGLSRPQESAPRRNESGLAWRLTALRKTSRRERLLSGKPEIAMRGHSQEAVDVLTRSLVERDWDAVVFDSLCAGWALDAVVQHRARSARPPKLVYLAHNHEVTVARRIAGASRGIRRLVRELDAFKVARLERRLVTQSDLVTSNTPEDCRSFAAGADGTPVAFLPPGYGGERVAARTIGPDVPRRVVVIGSFDWPPKRIAIESFLAAAAPVLAATAIELQIVGAVEPDYLADLRRRHPSVTFVGPVEDVRPYMAAARIALVPDLLGGFKLKGLDYVFNRIPILAMRLALPGMPLVHGRSIGLFDSHQALAEGVVGLIDDFATLNRRQVAAFDACAARFDWQRIGQHLLAHIERISSGPAYAGGRSSSTPSVPAPATAER
jgi:glycosyltransferase involved in cell wall biosynthesis